VKIQILSHIRSLFHHRILENPPHVLLAKKGSDVTVTQVKSREKVNEIQARREDPGSMRNHSLRSVRLEEVTIVEVRRTHDNHPFEVSEVTDVG
jgi:hypothetical protein